MEKDIRPMSEQTAEARQATFEEMLRHEEGRWDDHRVQTELTDVAALKISLATLADCPKTSRTTLINQKPYKVTAYFVSNQRGFEPALPQGHGDVLSAEMVAAWHANGWLLVDGVLPAGLVAAAAADGAAIYPTPSGSNGTAEQLASSGQLHASSRGCPPPSSS